MDMSRDNDKKERESPYIDMSRDGDQKICVYK